MKKALSFLVLALLTLAVLPEGVLAASRTFKELADNFYNLLGGLVPIIVSLAIVAFLYGVQKYILAGASEDKVKEGREMMIYGIIGIFVMVSVWGLVRIVVQTFFGTTDSPADSTGQTFTNGSVETGFFPTQ